MKLLNRYRLINFRRTKSTFGHLIRLVEGTNIQVKPPRLMLAADYENGGKMLKIDINLLCIECKLHEGKLNNCIEQLSE